MLVASSLLEDVVTRLCGPRHARQPHRTHTRCGHQRGTATLAGQKIPIARPRVRRTDGCGDVPLETYARLQSPEAMPQAVLRRMVRGVSACDYENVIVLTRDGFGVQKSSVSRDFVRASAAQVKALAERRFEPPLLRRPDHARDRPGAQDLAGSRRAPLDLRPHMALWRAQGPRRFRKTSRVFQKE